MVRIYSGAQNESDSGIEESSEKSSEPQDSETPIENDSDKQLEFQEKLENSDDDLKQLEKCENSPKLLQIKEKYDFAIKEGFNALATVQNGENALERRSETTSDDDFSSEVSSLDGDTSVVKAYPPGLVGLPPTKNIFNVTESKEVHCGDVVNVNNNVVVKVVNPKSSQESIQDSIESGRKKLSTTIKGVAGGVLCILILVIIIVGVEITQLQNTTSGEKPTYDEAWEGNVTLVTRKQWNARVPDPPTEVFATPPKMVVIVHTAGRTCPSANISCKEIVRLIQSGHMALGWRDIGYNFLVGGDGQVYAGTSWNHEGRHSLDENNKKSIAIAFIGNFNKSVPTREQLDAARTVVEVGFQLGKLNPNASVVFQSQIRPFDSPGINVENVIKQEWPWWSPLGDKDAEKHLNFTELFFERSKWFAANPERAYKKNNTFPLKNVKIHVKESNNQTNTLNDEAWEGNVTLVTRKQWNARVPDPPTEVFATPPKMVVIVHTAGRTCPSANISCKEIVRLIQSGHMALGWRDIGYNFLVGGDGQVYAGTSWNHEGRHSLDENNKKSIAIAFIGNFNKSVPTREQLDAARTVVEVGFQLGKLNPNASVVFQSQIRPFDSPGINVENVIKQEWPWWSPLGDKDAEKHLNFTELFFERSKWFAANPERAYKKNNTFPLKNVKIHVKESNNQTNTLKTVMELQKSYIEDGNVDLPSNFVIARDGCIFEGRGWNYAGAHSEDSQDIEIEILVSVIRHVLEKKIAESMFLLIVAGINEGKLTKNCGITCGGPPTFCSLFDGSTGSDKPATPKDDTYDVEDHSGPGNITWVSRKTCGLQNPTKYVNVTRLPLPSDSVIISHSVTPECTSEEKCCPRVASIQAHMMTWSYDVGYHFLVGSDGNVYEGRMWDEVGAHTPGANCKLGVAFIGNFMDKPPMEKQVDAAFRLFDGLVSANLLTPNYTIFGQNDVRSSPTESPGKVLIEMMASWPHYRKEDQIVKGPCT